MNLMYGSRGDEVKKLQTALNSTGSYTLSVDGRYGPKTQAAVRDYQTKNGLKIDGIAGTETLGHLYRAAETGPQTAVPQPEQKQETKLTYDPAADPGYQQALAALQQAQKNLPSYKGSFDGELQQLYGQIANREAFSYDPNADLLYRQMAEQYARQGRLAMEDTVGQAAALTGGYGSSYAQTAGQQQYGAYLQRLNEAVPELYAAAYDRYEKEGQALQQRYAMVSGLAEGEYSRYQDALSQYWKNVSQLQDAADEAYRRGVEADKIAYDRQQDALEQLSKAGGRGGQTAESAADSEPVKQDTGYTAEQIFRAQRFIGAPMTGVWDTASAVLARRKGFGHLGAVVAAVEIRDAEDRR